MAQASARQIDRLAPEQHRELPSVQALHLEFVTDGVTDGGLLYYRADLYKAAGLKVPETWDELQANAAKLHAPPAVYGMVPRGARSASDISYDWMPYLHGHGGGIFKDEKAGDFTVTLNAEAGRQALGQSAGQHRAQQGADAFAPRHLAPFLASALPRRPGGARR